MKRFGILALAMCLTITLGARDPRDDEIRQLKAVVKIQKAQIAQLKHALELAREGKPLPVASRPVRPKPVAPPKPMRPFQNPLKVGMVGYVTHVRVLSTRSDNDMVALVHLANRVRRKRMVHGQRVMLWEADVARVWVTGLDASAVKAGEIVDVGQRMKVVAHKRLPTDGMGGHFFRMFQLKPLP